MDLLKCQFFSETQLLPGRSQTFERRAYLQGNFRSECRQTALLQKQPEIVQRGRFGDLTVRGGKMETFDVGYERFEFRLIAGRCGMEPFGPEPSAAKITRILLENGVRTQKMVPEEKAQMAFQVRRALAGTRIRFAQQFINRGT